MKWNTWLSWSHTWRFKWPDTAIFRLRLRREIPMILLLRREETCFEKDICTLPNKVCSKVTSGTVPVLCGQVLVVSRRRSGWSTIIWLPTLFQYHYVSLLKRSSRFYDVQTFMQRGIFWLLRWGKCPSRCRDSTFWMIGCEFFVRVVLYQQSFIRLYPSAFRFWFIWTFIQRSFVWYPFLVMCSVGCRDTDFFESCHQSRVDRWCEWITNLQQLVS